MKNLLPIIGNGRISLLILSSFLLVFSKGFGQTEEQKQWIEQFSVKKSSIWHQQRAEAESIAIRLGIPIRKEYPDGSVIELQRFENGKAVYYITCNIDAAQTISTNRVWQNGGYGFSLTGRTDTLGIWDGGAPRDVHQELTGRVIRGDTAFYNNHSTHVAGTMVATGVSARAKGMSNQGYLRAYDWNNCVSEMATAAADGLKVSNHSWGYITGWLWNYFGDNRWVWFGDSTISNTEDYTFGFYNSEARDWDDIVWNAPYFLIVKSAGNDRDDVPSNQPIEHWVWVGEIWDLRTVTRDQDGGSDGYDCISDMGVAKNIITVGAVNDIPGGYTQPSDVLMSSFSGWGPSDDGRIKPDIVANGIGLYSSIATSNSAYATYSGTSMSSPNVSGSVGLLLQHRRNLFGNNPLRSSTIKALIIHTADEAGPNPGPDYMFGWGLMNTLKAVQVMQSDYSVGGNLMIKELTLNQAGEIEFQVLSDGTQPIRATICWTDPAGIPPAPALNPPTIMLVNDIDLRIIRDGTTYLPWILDPSNPSAAATTGDNIRDNVEQINIVSPIAGQYTVRINHKGTLSGGSAVVSLIITGITIEPSFAVSTPNGGETWGIGSTQKITWEPGSVTGNVKIELSRDGGSTYETLFANTANDGSENWTVISPATPTASVKISSISNPTVFDVSDANFIVVQPTITVSVPNGGEDWCIGTSQEIKWTLSGISGNVMIELSRDGGSTYETLFASTANYGWEQWTTTGPVTSMARVRISSIDLPSVSDVSDVNFSIIEPQFTEVFAGSLEGVHSSSSTWGDYDNDGDLDILLTGYEMTRYEDRFISKIYQNNGPSGFTEVFAGSLTGVYYSSAAWGDYDNDGDLDILLTGRAPEINEWNGISKIYQNNGPSGFTEVFAGSLTGGYQGSAAWGDYDNDGDLDILLTGYNESICFSKIYRNNEHSGFTEVFKGSLTGGRSSSAAWGDYDNDGDLDILLTSGASKIYQNNGPSGFTEVFAGSMTGVSQGSAAWGDYDNDGDLDILLTGVSNESRCVSKIYQNTGPSGFTEVFAGSLTRLVDSFGAWGDYDNDGDLDILLTGWDAYGDTYSKIYQNTGTGFIEVFAGSLTGVSEGSAAWGDYDNDGDLDILLTGDRGIIENWTDVSKIYRNNGAVFNTVPVAPTGLNTVVSGNTVTLGWNKAADAQTPQDGLTYNLRIGTNPNGIDKLSPMADVSSPQAGYRRVVSIGNANQVTSYPVNNLWCGTYYWSVQAIDNSFAGSPFSAEGTFSISGPSAKTTAATNVSFTSATLNGTVNANDLTTNVRFVYGTSAGNYTDSITALNSPVSGTIDMVVSANLTNLSLDQKYYYRAAASNVDGYVRGNEWNFTTLPYLSEVFAGSLAGVQQSSAEWGDYDNDGDLDILLSGASKIYQNNGPSGFTEVFAGSLTGGGNRSAWGDYDNDGDLDILLTGGRDSKIYQNTGSGFTEVFTGNLPGVGSSSVAWGDYDNDGVLDILLTGSVGSYAISKIYRNTGSGFTEVFAGSLPGVGSSSVAWGDYDNDGDLDILLTGSDGSHAISKIYQNTGSGFTEVFAGSLTGVYFSSVAWGDYDNDGDLDILLTGYNGSLSFSKIYKNNGASGFTEVFPGSLTEVGGGSAAWGDYDNDGDLDILLTGYIGYSGSNGVSKIYQNNGPSGFTEVFAGSLTGVYQSSAAWGDYDNDGDLDILLTGWDGPGTRAISKIYRINGTTFNTVPVAPTGLKSVVSGNTVTFGWNKAEDAQTPQNGLTYNLRIGTSPDGIDKLSPMADVDSPQTGYRRVVSIGNTNQVTSYAVKRLLPGTYYWSVQAIDNGFAGSPFSEVDSFAITQNTLQISVRDGWNMVSVPLIVSDYRKTVLFPTAISSAFTYENIYVEKPTLANAIGYWLQFNGDQNVNLTGMFRSHDTVNVVEGWNMIGSIGIPVPVSSITSIPGGIITSDFFGYTDSYNIIDSIKPGKGYWVWVTQNGKLILTSTISKELSASIKVVHTDELPPPSPDEGMSTPVPTIPRSFGLEQNYPNPFNPTTKVSFVIGQSSFVTLKVYDVLGQEVATLVNEKREAGRYEVIFSAEGGSASGGDGSKLTSGVYFYRLRANDPSPDKSGSGQGFIQTKKFIIVK